MEWTGGEPGWDEIKARQLVGSVVLCGITYCDASGAVSEQLQIFGIVTEATKGHGITLECHGQTKRDELFVLPPDTDAFQVASAGTYKLRTTGETVIDPTFTSSWTITKPKN